MPASSAFSAPSNPNPAEPDLSNVVETLAHCRCHAASVIDNARLRNSIVRWEVVIEEGAEIEDCIIMDYVRVRRGARLRRTIVDRHNLIEKDTRIDWDAAQNRERYTVSPSGVVVVPRDGCPTSPENPGATAAVTGSSRRSPYCRSLYTAGFRILTLAY